MYNTGYDQIRLLVFTSISHKYELFKFPKSPSLGVDISKIVDTSKSLLLGTWSGDI